MAGKPKSMSQIKQLLLLHQQGKGKKTIARLLGMSKTTVKVYLQKLQLLTSSAKGAKPLTLARSGKAGRSSSGSQVSIRETQLTKMSATRLSRLTWSIT